MKHMKKPSSTRRVPKRSLERLLRDVTPVAKRLQRRLVTLQRRSDPDLSGTLQDLVLGQLALIAAVSALLEVQVEVKSAFGE